MYRPFDPVCLKPDKTTLRSIVSKSKILTVFGTRPEAIKLAPVVRALKAQDMLNSVLVSTGQHREMLGEIGTKLGLVPNYDLALMQPNQSLNSLVARVIDELDKILFREKPDLVLVQGDTSSAFAAGLAGFQSGAEIIHLEAGLRTGDNRSPFPEEANRKLLTQISSLHLAPSNYAKQNLLDAGVQETDIAVTGNTVIDTLFEAIAWHEMPEHEDIVKAIVNQRRIVLVTMHRRENLGSMPRISLAIRQLAVEYTDVLFVVPLHLNPNVRRAVVPVLEGCRNILITRPAPYGEFTTILNACMFVLTDSGGIQEEAPALGKPVLALRRDTERVEAVEAGTVKLVGTEPEVIFSNAKRLLEDPALYEEMASARNPYGDGNSSKIAVDAMKQKFL